MGQPIHWVRELPPDGWDEDGLTFICTQEILDRIGDYTRSWPTGPSTGRIFKRNEQWPEDMEDRFMVHVVSNKYFHHFNVEIRG